MIIYSITFAIEPNIENEWVKHVQQEFIHHCMNLGQFSEYRFTKILDGQGLDLAYNLQFKADNLHKVNHYVENHSSTLESQMHQKFPNSFASFFTLLEEVK